MYDIGIYGIRGVPVARQPEEQVECRVADCQSEAVQRIPDAKCNGDMHAALDYELEQKHDLENFLTRQGVNHITGE